MKSFKDFLTESLTESRADSHKFQIPNWYTKEIAPYAQALEVGTEKLPKELKPYKDILDTYAGFMVNLPDQVFQDDDYLRDKSNLSDFMHEDFFDSTDFDSDLISKFEDEDVWGQYYKFVTKKTWKW